MWHHFKKEVIMLLSLDNLRGYRIHGTDGEIGQADSFLFNDTGWHIRYLVVDTGPLIFGKKVLISPASIHRIDRDGIYIDLETEQIKNSPSIDTDKPVSRRMETELHLYYGWPFYWNTSSTISPVELASPPMPDPEQLEKKLPDEQEGKDRVHLRSSREVTGYWVHSKVDNIGRVDDFIVDTEQWSIPYAVIDLNNQFSGKKVLISIQWIKAIRWRESALVVEVPANVIAESPEFNPYEPVNRNVEEVLYDYYGIAHR
jgi:hypothetical protein